MKTGLSFILPKPNDENNFGTSETSDYNPSYSAYLDGTSMQLVSPNKYLPMSLNEIEAKSERVKKRLLASVSDRDRIMELTVNQHESKFWYDVRQPRITASKVKRCLIKPTTSPTKAIADVLNYHAPIQTKAMKQYCTMLYNAVHCCTMLHNAVPDFEFDFFRNKPENQPPSLFFLCSLSS